MCLKNRKGVTLIEVIIALALSVVIITILIAALRLGYRSQEKGDWRDEVSQKVRIINYRITWLLRGAYPYIVTKPEGKVIYFSGESDSVGLVTSSVDTYSERPEDKAGLKWIQIFSDSEGLKVREKFYFLEDVFDDSGGEVYLIDPSVSKIEFEYFDVNKEEKTEDWVSEWVPEDKEYLPSAVRVNIEFVHDKIKFKMPEFIVRLSAS
ncbi:MAG: prepilin-type N-terminal cleavage/methylation domain-containing protein [Nitrospirae bacterium]|nr:prepilin-type N-terminal cleavage/methylation domain-containing protein [Nitrospirota bacterium]